MTRQTWRHKTQTAGVLYVCSFWQAADSHLIDSLIKVPKSGTPGNQ